MTKTASAVHTSSTTAPANDKAKAPLINAQTHTLANGLKVIILPSGIAPIVSVGVLYNVGTADDPVDEVGLSHFIEHMMFKGTKSVSSAEFDKTILRVGGKTNALTEYDYTLFYTTVPVTAMEDMLRLEGDRMQNLSFTNEQVISEQKVVQEERNMRIENNPLGTVMERYLQAFNPYHPYGVLPIGFPHHISKYSYDSLRSHYDQWYHPNNAVVVITGKTTLAEALPMIEKYFGAIPKKTVPNRNRFQNPDRDGVSQTIVQHNKRNSLVMLYWCYDAPHFLNPEGKKYYYALELIRQLLGGNSATDFTHKFVDVKKQALELSSDYDGDSLDPKDFSISAILSPDMKVATIKKSIQDYLKNLIKNGVSPALLSRAKNDTLASLATLKDGTEKYLQAVAQNIGKGKTIEDLNTYQEHIEAVSVEDIKIAAAYVFDKDPVVVIEMYPAKGQ